jgi:bifunctional DNA-binding transcriptional regulator/antitoxin component of YhaV-PrlF toxin-antitoxin module
VLPADMRRRLGLQAGDQVSISEESEGVLRVETRRSAARALIGMAGSGGPSAVEELRADRQRERSVEEQRLSVATRPASGRDA